MQDSLTKTFTCPTGEQFRVLVRDNEPWFIGKEIASKLGYATPKKAIYDHVCPEDKLTVQLADIQEGSDLEKAHMKGSKCVIINESGLYSLIIASQLPSARIFKRWVTHEVLPSIRKHGAYIREDMFQRFLNDPAALRQMVCQLADEQESKKRPTLVPSLVGRDDSHDCIPETYLDGPVFMAFNDVESEQHLLTIKRKETTNE